MQRIFLQLAVTALAFAAGAAVGAIVTAAKVPKRKEPVKEPKPDNTPTAEEPVAEEKSTTVHAQLGSLCGAGEEYEKVTCETCETLLGKPYHIIPPKCEEEEEEDEFEVIVRPSPLVEEVAERLISPVNEPSTPNPALKRKFGPDAPDPEPEVTEAEVTEEPEIATQEPEVASNEVVAVANATEFIEITMELPEPTAESPRGKHWKAAHGTIIGNGGEIVNRKYFDNPVWVTASDEEKEGVIDLMNDSALRRRVVDLGSHVGAGATHAELVLQVVSLEEKRLECAAPPRRRGRRPHA